MRKSRRGAAALGILGLMVITSCATQYYAFDGDYNGNKAEVELSEEERALQDRLFEQIGNTGELTTGEHLIRRDESGWLGALRY